MYTNSFSQKHVFTNKKSYIVTINFCVNELVCEWNESAKSKLELGTCENQTKFNHWIMVRSFNAKFWFWNGFQPDFETDIVMNSKWASIQKNAHQVECQPRKKCLVSALWDHLNTRRYFFRGNRSYQFGFGRGGHFDLPKAEAELVWSCPGV